MKREKNDSKTYPGNFLERYHVWYASKTFSSFAFIRNTFYFSDKKQHSLSVYTCLKNFNIAPSVKEII